MSNQGLYTISLEFDGGTYTSQVMAESLTSGLLAWAERLKDEDLNSWGIERTELFRIQEESDPVPLMDLVNVWCLTGIVEGKQVIVNLVKTAFA